MCGGNGSRHRQCFWGLLRTPLLALLSALALRDGLQRSWVYGMVQHVQSEPATLGLVSHDAAGVARAAADATARGAELWPSGRGRQGRYGWAEHAGPQELGAGSLAWSWSHPGGRFHTLTYGTVIDSQMNIYLSAADAIRKFSVDGRLLWEYSTLPAESINAPLLMDGMLFGSETFGLVYALSMETGKLVWSTRVSNCIAGDNGFVAGHEGMLVVGGEGRGMEYNDAVIGLNATSGMELWRFRPDVSIWNFMASFPGDGTVVYQDLEGRTYRHRLRDGELLWKVGGGPKGYWTDGTATLGANGVVYAVNTFAVGWAHGTADTNGELSAYRLEDGTLLWRVTTPRPPNNAPAVGRLHGRSGLSVVQPMGQQVLRGAPTSVVAYDAGNGSVQWEYDGPRQEGLLQAADWEGMLERVVAGVRPICLPNPWSAPTIDAAGTVFIGNQDGLFVALRDLDGDGRVAGEAEVSSYDTKACFAGSAGPSVAPGLVAVASCDSLFVFRRSESPGAAAA